MTYRVKLDNFEGPLDLLLYLVEKEKINILEVSLASIVDQFMEYLAIMEELSLEIAGSFLVVAATLLEIKSRRLLPKLPGEALEEEEESEMALLERLLQYKQFKEAALLLSEREGAAALHYARNPESEHAHGSEPIQVYREASLFDLLAVLNKFSFKPPPPKRFAPARSVVNVIVVLENVRQRLAEGSRLLFRDLIVEAPGRDAAIALFLAVLELMRLREIVAVQEYLFGEILLIRSETLEFSGQVLEQAS